VSDKRKETTIGVHMRLPVAIVKRLDELAESTAGSRGDVIKLLIGQARLTNVHEVTVKRGDLRLGGDAEAALERQEERHD